MKRWDSWRRYITEGGEASWPRDAFESMLDEFETEMEELKNEVRSCTETT